METAQLEALGPRPPLLMQHPGLLQAHQEEGLRVSGPESKWGEYLGQDPAHQEKLIQILCFLALVGPVGSGFGSNTYNSSIFSALQHW